MNLKSLKKLTIIDLDWSEVGDWGVKIFSHEQDFFWHLFKVSHLCGLRVEFWLSIPKVPGSDSSAMPSGFFFSFFPPELQVIQVLTFWIHSRSNRTIFFLLWASKSAKEVKWIIFSHWDLNQGPFIWQTKTLTIWPREMKILAWKVLKTLL